MCSKADPNFKSSKKNNPAFLIILLVDWELFFFIVKWALGCYRVQMTSLKYLTFGSTAEKNQHELWDRDFIVLHIGISSSLLGFPHTMAARCQQGDGESCATLSTRPSKLHRVTLARFNFSKHFMGWGHGRENKIDSPSLDCEQIQFINLTNVNYLLCWKIIAVESLKTSFCLILHFLTDSLHFFTKDEHGYGGLW